MNLLKNKQLIQVEQALYSLADKKVRISCSELYPDQALIGTVEKFWIDDVLPEKINFQIKLATDGKLVTHALIRPVSFEHKDNTFVFDCGAKYTFELI